MRPCRTCWRSLQRRQTRPWQQMVTRRYITTSVTCVSFWCAARRLTWLEHVALPRVEAPFPLATMLTCV